MTAAPGAHPFGGIYASAICPMDAAGRVDEDALAAHLEPLVAAEGMAGLLLNGHAGENWLLSRSEMRQVLNVGRQVAGDKRIVAGVNAERANDAAALAEDAADAGADAVMVVPPYSWAAGPDHRLVEAHHLAVTKASTLPLFLFQASIHAGRTHFGGDTLTRLLEIDAVAGIKEGSWETSAYEATRRLTQRLRPNVAVMASGDEHLFPCFVLGSEGSLVSLAAVIPELIVALDGAVRAGDLKAARKAHEAIYPLAAACYRAPGHLTPLRLKECLRLTGRLSSTTVRAAPDALSAGETATLRAALVVAGALPH